MTTTVQKLTLEQYLTYDDGTDIRYELVDGELVPMAQPKGLHGMITEFLNDEFRAEIKRLELPWASKQTTIAIQSPRGGRWDTFRIPDVMVLLSDQWQEMRDREAIIRLNEPPPLLVVEVISESTKLVDYRTKRSEYAVLDIQEYWIVDPLEQAVTLCNLVEGFYDASEYRGGARLGSPTFPSLALTAEQVFAVGQA